MNRRRFGRGTGGANWPRRFSARAPRAAGRPRDRQSRLGLAFRQATGRDDERFRHAGRRADASANCWTIWRRASSPTAGRSNGCIAKSCCRRRYRQASRPREDGGSGSRQPAAVADEPAAAGHRGLARYDPAATPAKSRSGTWAVRRWTSRQEQHPPHRLCQHQPRRAQHAAASSTIFPTPMHAPGRELTTTPLQQLFVMNSAFVQDQSRTLAAQAVAGLRRREGADPASVPDHSGRAMPRPVRSILALSYLDKADWAGYAQALLGSNEFIFWP